MSNFMTTLDQTMVSMQANVMLTLYLIAGLLLIHVVNCMVGYRLNVLGIYPRNVPGLLGIFFAPVLHGNFGHLFFNSIPLFILANFILLEGVQKFYCVTAVIVLISGALVWLLGRKALHVGASSVIMGYWGYLLFFAYQQQTLLAIVLGFVCLYYFGGLFLSMLPGETGVSWEGHLFGFLAGLSAVYLCSSALS